MKLIKPYFEIEDEINREELLKKIEKAGRTCYKSEDRITEDSSKKFIEMILNKGHETVIEHEKVTVRVICDRGVTHEIVRHRLFSYSQESTRYCNYSGGVVFIIPCWFSSVIEPGLYKWNTDNSKGIDSKSLGILKNGVYDTKLHSSECNAERGWLNLMLEIEEDYIWLIEQHGWTPQQARSVLPNSLKTEIVMTANLREWKHFFKLRTSTKAHPQMQEIARPLLDEFKNLIPIIFDDINYEDTKN